MATPTYGKGAAAYQASIKAMTNTQVFGHLETRVAQIHQMIQMNLQRSGQLNEETQAVQQQIEEVKKHLKSAKEAATRAGKLAEDRSKANAQPDGELSQIAEKEMAKVLASTKLLGEKFARAGFPVR